MNSNKRRCTRNLNAAFVICTVEKDSDDDEDYCLNATCNASEHEDEEVAHNNIPSQSTTAINEDIVSREIFHGCCNCRRSNCTDASDHALPPLELEELPVALLKKGRRCQFHFIDFPNVEHFGTAKLCQQCKAYVLSAGNKERTSKNTWPAFIWSILRQDNLRNKCWLFLPTKWRLWWTETLTMGELLDHDNGLFEDVTHATRSDLAALKSLKWTDLMRREESLALPSVKCPAGCAEWKHKALNHLPLDIVFEHYLDFELKLYSASKMRQCCNFFREDYLQPDHILHNDSWSVKASILFLDTGEPVVLCCRYHSSKNKLVMIHPPRHPTGSIASSKASQFCPAIVVPRTISTSKAMKYSASLSMTSLEGSYFGLDTMFLTQSGTNSSMNHSDLSWKHECLAIKARKDIRNHVDKLRKSGSITQLTYDRLAEDANAHYPNWSEMKSKFVFGSSFVKSCDAVLLHNKLKYEGSESVVIKINTTGEEKTITIVSGWPKCIMWAHPSCNQHGRPLPPVPKFQIPHVDSRTAWFISAVLMSVPETWAAACNVKPKRYDRWEGHLLTFITAEVLPHCARKKTRGNPFGTSKKSMSHMCTEHFGAKANMIYHPDEIQEAFPATLYSTVLVSKEGKDIPSDTHNVIIVTNNSSADTPVCFPALPDDWELRSVFLSHLPKPKNIGAWKGTYFYRHGGNLHPLWWSHQRGRQRSEAMKPHWTPHNLTNEDLSNWTACVYVKKTNSPVHHLRDSLLSTCGGQKKVLCHQHRYPLITTPTKCTTTCTHLTSGADGERLTCSKKASLLCPEDGCTIALCKDHADALDCRSQACYIAKDGNVAEHHENESNDHNEAEVPFLQTQEKQNGNGLIRFARLGDSDCAIEAEFELNEQQEDDFFQTVDSQFVEGMEENESDTDEEPDFFAIPTTNAAEKPIYSVVETEPYKSCAVSNHVILNHFGSCLIRRNADMSGTKTQKSFLQKIIATTPGSSVPLLYPEGMLFTDLFFSDESDGSTTGALPVCLMHDASVLQQNGFATLEDHFRTRMATVGLLASSNPKYHFWAFDNLINLGLRGCDTRAILRRGFTDTHKGGVRFREQPLPIFDTEQVDCRPVVNKLAATAAERSPTYFFTWTLSMKTHFGIRILYDYVNGDELVSKLSTAHTTQKEREILKKEILDSAGTLLLRAWMEISHIWISYIVDSPDRPIGHIDMHFSRAELQDPNALANLPHWHCIFWTKDNLKTEDGLFAALDRIRGHISDIVRPDERKALIKDGIFQNNHDIICFLDTMQTFLTHKHLRRCYAMVRNRDSEEEVSKLVCKVSNNYRLNPTPMSHSFIRIKVEHSQEAIFIFQNLGLAQPPNVDHVEGETLFFVPLHPCLVSEKHIPPSCKNDGIISPVPGWLVARNPSSCNIQFTTGYLIMRYLAKYVASIDLYNIIRLSPPTKQDATNTLKVDGQLQLNNKITGNKIHQQRENTTTSGRFPKVKQARGINISETYMMHFQYDPILTNIEWIHVQTQPYEERTARERTPPLTNYARNTDRFSQYTNQRGSLKLDGMVPSHLARCKLKYVDWKMFTSNQLKKATDDLQSPYTTDTVTVFGMRPPELRFAMTQLQYARWFKRKPFNGDLVNQLNMCMKNMHKTKMERTSWIDASSAIIYVRALAVPEVLSHLRSCQLRFFHVRKSTARMARAALIKLFDLILESINFKNTGVLPLPGRSRSAMGTRGKDIEEARREDLKECFARFVCDNTKERLPTTWFSSVRPTQPHRFLIHLLLSMGQFVDEYSLFNQPSLRHSFIHAGLLDENDIAGSIHRVAHGYVTQQLASLPAGTTTFDKYAVAAYNTIKELFLNNEFHSFELPSVLYCRLTTITEKKVLTYIEKRKITLIKYLLSKLKDPTSGCLPTLEECMDASIESPCTWDPTALPETGSQPEASRAEQKRLMNICKIQIQQYKSGTLACTKGVCVVGAGGVGKTTASLMMLLYAICQGLNCAITANNSERAQELASIHLASLLCMPRANHLSPGQLAERCISNLYRKPEKREFLRTLDVLLLDEAGMISAEYMLVKCIVSKYIKGTNRPNGGMLLQATMDNLQIDPCSGRHPLLSPLFVSNFIFFRLHECVRSATDEKWMRLQQITRLPLHALEDTVIKQEFIDLFVNNVGSIPSTAQRNLPPNSLFVYGKNEPLRTQQKKLFSKLNAKCKKIHLVSVADDKERTVEGRMIPATRHTSDILDRRIKEPRELYFYIGGRYQITANDQGGKYSNSQLVMLFHMPTQEQLEKKQPIKMLLAPPGSRYIPSDKDERDDLLKLGWTDVFVHACSDKNVTSISKGIRATRIQYVLRHHIGSTLHSIMGQTLSKLITEVSRGINSPYSLWLASQVVVLLSRTKTAADTIFVTTDMHETAEILYEILLQTTPFRTYISELLDKLCAPYETGEPVTVNHFKSIYQCRNAQLPLDNTGSVYLLISLANPGTAQGTYIGSTKHLAKRLNQHNTNWGSKQTAPACLRPWAILAYVCGFDSHYTKMRAFEEEWIGTRNAILKKQSRTLTVKGTITIVKDLLRDWKTKHPGLSLRLVECGSIQHVEEMRDD